MSLSEKQVYARLRICEPVVTSPVCETQTAVAELLAHLAARCAGRRPPSPHSSWLSWCEALALGAPRATMARWVSRGEVRVRGEQQDRQYLMRDVVLRLAARWQRGHAKSRSR